LEIRTAPEGSSWRVPGPTPSLRVDQADAIGAVLAQPALGRTSDDDIRQHNQANSSEPVGIDNFENCRIGIVEFPPEHRLDVHDGDVCPTSVLEKLGIHN
jgi:hypothetical protein